MLQWPWSLAFVTRTHDFNVLLVFAEFIYILNRLSWTSHRVTRVHCGNDVIGLQVNGKRRILAPSRNKTHQPTSTQNCHKTTSTLAAELLSFFMIFAILCIFCINDVWPSRYSLYINCIFTRIVFISSISNRKSAKCVLWCKISCHSVAIQVPLPPTTMPFTVRGRSHELINLGD